MRFVLASLLCLPVLGLLRAEDKPEPVKIVKLDRKEPVTFEEVDAIFADKCLYCHAGAVQESKFDMRTYESLMKGGRRHGDKVVLPGRPNDSILVKMAARLEEPVMPPVKENKVLTPEELALVKLWIEQGAKGPSGTTGPTKRTPKLLPLPPGVNPVVALAISPDKSMVAAGRGNHIHVYDAGSGNYVRSLVNPHLKDDKNQPFSIAHLDIVQSIAFSPDGKHIASGGFQEIVLWDAATGEFLRQIDGFADRVVALDFSKDGKWLAAAGGAPTEDGEIRVLEVPSGKIVVEIKNGHSDTVFGVRFSPDGGKLASAAADKFVKVWEMPTGKFIKSFEGHTHHVMDVGWKHDGKVLASGGADNVVKIWDYEKGEQIRTINNAHGKQVTRLMFIGATSNFATCSGDATIKFFNADNGGNVRNFGGNNDFLYALGVSPDGTIVAAGGQEAVVRLYNGTNGQLLKTLQPPPLEK